MKPTSCAPSSSSSSSTSPLHWSIEDTQTSLRLFAQKHKLTEQEQNGLLTAFRRTDGQSLLKLTYEQLKERIPDIEVAQLLSQEIQCLNDRNEEHLVKRQKTTLLEQENTNGCNSPGSFVDAKHLIFAGLSIMDNHRFYVREDWAKKWQELITSQNLLLNGPPGTGKSSLVWFWCCWAASQNQTIRWVHIDRMDALDIVDFSGSHMSTYGSRKKKLNKIISMTTAPVLVIDGITKDHKIFEAKHWVRNRKHRLILVTSDQFTWNCEDYQQMYMIELTLSGWSYHEYIAACRDEVFFNSIKANLDADMTTTDSQAMIDAKYYFAGASARYMFSFNTETVLNDTLKHIGKLNNKKDVLSGLLFFGTRGSLAVNHLFSNIGGNNILVSQYVTRALSKHCDAAFVVEATNHARSIRIGAFDGWIFQLDFFQRLASERNLKFTNSAEQWHNEMTLEFKSETDLDEGGKFVDNCFLLPTKVNQGCYDALQITGDTLRVIQVTVAKSHNLRMEYVAKVLMVLMNHWKIVNLDVVMVLPPENIEHFNLSSVSGDKMQIFRTLKWKKDNYRKLGYARRS